MEQVIFSGVKSTVPVCMIRLTVDSVGLGEVPGFVPFICLDALISELEMRAAHVLPEVQMSRQRHRMKLLYHLPVSVTARCSQRD